MNKKNVYITHTNCITPLGFTVESNMQAIANGLTGISYQDNSALLPEPFFAGVIHNDKLDTAFAALSTKAYTRLEKMMLLALEPVIKKSVCMPYDKTALILSTTKGNITSLTNKADLPKEAYLQELAQNIADFFGFTTQPIVISNACVSGTMAVSVAKRLVQAGIYNNVFVISGDEVSEFVLSGFNSFQALSPEPCRPYSANRKGVTLGEAAAAALITTDSTCAKAKIAGDGSINDANHISGPSRTGEGLVKSIESAMREAEITAGAVDYISAHGTATPFNDEMEAIAFNRTGLNHVPVNSFKGYYGHTLGASGLLETVIALESMAQNKVFASLGYDEPGVSQPINVIVKNEDRKIDCFLKTASGFGGCNTAVVFQKVNNGK
ncbi:beta-ketoacyl synthase N-terminal-like domain-containing protein [Flavobacterium sp. NRK1]|uniref:beta-ketoacyl synthase N-terminal-like domain-containing protein n=1 Tax=Flavobacterium sp. NRK1 TaxID=2954929 RepID=UPI002092E7D9|nr:beta-ketoacyl synthase N-terminal-like domain-containing protein [Flavobacterium sp. NRK1]MCO6147286.1 beta-ketoacyl synthase [Flavobacterium sp. NRK1]